MCKLTILCEYSWFKATGKITILKGQYAEILACPRHLKYFYNQNISFGHVWQASITFGLHVYLLFGMGFICNVCRLYCQRIKDMSSSAPAVVAPISFDDFRLGRSAQFVVARFLRFWDSKNIKKQGEFMGITLLFLDEQVLFHLFTIKLLRKTDHLIPLISSVLFWSHVYFLFCSQNSVIHGRVGWSAQIFDLKVLWESIFWESIRIWSLDWFVDEDQFLASSRKH